MHVLFHIKTVIIPRDRYRPEGFSPRVDIGRGMITVLIWKKACTNLFITYFNIELKRTKLTSHTDTKLMDEWSISVEGSASETPTSLSSLNVDIFQTTIWFGRKWRHGAHERLDIVLSEFCPMADIAVALPVFYVWEKSTLLLINMW
jgi:hypothetical protein